MILENLGIAAITTGAGSTVPTGTPAGLTAVALGNSPASVPARAATRAPPGVPSSATFCCANLARGLGVTSAPACATLSHPMEPAEGAETVSEDQVVDGLKLSEWRAMYRPGMPEYPATRFAFTLEAKDCLRVAFGNSGPIIDHQSVREPLYTFAVTLSPEMAVNLAHHILKFYAKPDTDPALSSMDLQS